MRGRARALSEVDLKEKSRAFATKCSGFTVSPTLHKEKTRTEEPKLW